MAAIQPSPSGEGFNDRYLIGLFNLSFTYKQYKY